MSEKNSAIDNVLTVSYLYNKALTEVSILRNRLGSMCASAHDSGVSDREIAKAASLSRARIQQLRTDAKNDKSGT